MKETSISIMGVGNVGKGILSIIQRMKEEGQLNEDFRVISVSDSRGTVFDDGGINPKKILEAKEHGNIFLSGYSKMDTEDVLSLKSDIIVDVSPATRDGKLGRDLYMESFSQGKQVVTANKAPLSFFWKEIMNKAASSGLEIRYESTVAGGVPLFNLRDYCLLPSAVVDFRGIVSSTVNYILRKMRSGMDFNHALEEALKLGIVEANFRDDTDGIDSARKTVILANSLFGSSLTLNDIKYQGVDENTNFEDAAGDQRIIASVGISEGKVRAGSMLENLGEEDPLATLKHQSLGYVMKTGFSGDIFVAGLRDGPIETASGVVNDILLLSGFRRI
ncbi:homoserine dehydrogenase [Oxyplasma meridianum]|uniref:Homoserine dehydrogenase n=1 Tax=Oxyplasma meridianum TaxID=3073602 RepID=A0AAX4NFR1_9ARCH